MNNMVDIDETRGVRIPVIKLSDDEFGTAHFVFHGSYKGEPFTAQILHNSRRIYTRIIIGTGENVASSILKDGDMDAHLQANTFRAINNGLARKVYMDAQGLVADGKPGTMVTASVGPLDPDARSGRLSRSTTQVTIVLDQGGAVAVRLVDQERERLPTASFHIVASLITTSDTTRLTKDQIIDPTKLGLGAQAAAAIKKALTTPVPSLEQRHEKYVDSLKAVPGFKAPARGHTAPKP